MSNQSTVERLVDQALQSASGPLYTAMQLLIQDVYRGYNQLFPAPRVSQLSSIAGALPVTPDNSTFVIAAQPSNIHLSWATTGIPQIYEIRYVYTGSMQPLNPAQVDWDTATFLLQTHSLQADISPFTGPFLYGSYTFLLKSISNDGVYSDNFISVGLTIPRIQRPVITATTLNNNVLLRWTEPSSIFQINHYNVYANGVLVGTVKATFDVIMEQVGGTYSFTVEAVDIIGNIGLPATDVVVIVSNPIDFSHFASFTSSLAGTKVNTDFDTDHTLFAPTTSDDYEHHFTDNSYANWQDPITAGYPLYFEPSDTLVGTYEEIVDFGSTINKTIVSVDYNQTRAVGSVDIQCTLSFSTDNVTYDSPTSGFSRYAASVRYVKFKFTFTAADNKSSINVFNIRCVASVRRENDGGSLHVNNPSSHVTFNKTFLTIDAISITVASNNSYFAAYALDATPTAGFTIYVFDQNGTSIAADVSWVARGVIA